MNPTLSALAYQELASEPLTQVTGRPTQTPSAAAVRTAPDKAGVERQSKAKPRFAELACSFHEIERFAQAAVSSVVPEAFMGSQENRMVLDKCRFALLKRALDLLSLACAVVTVLSRYLRARRFETFSLHTLLHNFSLDKVPWLKRSSKGGSKTPLQSERQRQLLGEFLFWLVDNWLNDLLKVWCCLTALYGAFSLADFSLLCKTTFYVSESAAYRNRLLYFRMDDWKKICAPLFEDVSASIFERVPQVCLIALKRANEWDPHHTLVKRQVPKLLMSRSLGIGSLRLLPKQNGMRPIVNLAKKTVASDVFQVSDGTGPR